MSKARAEPKITHIYSFLVHDAKGLEAQPQIGGTRVSLSGRLFQMLSDMFDRSNLECDIAIAFRPADGKQENLCRSEFINLVKKPEIAAARVMAKRLQSVTTKRSGLGLLFIIVGKTGRRNRVHISRFPADVGILAEENADELRVEFLEKVFMKNAYAYKAATYEGTTSDGDFWDGRAVDKQINSKDVSISTYWISDFLISDFKTTAASGTRRLALALRKAIDTTEDVSLKSEITAMARLAHNMNGQSITVDNLSDRFHLSATARDHIVKQLDNPALQFERFQFSFEEFNKNLPYTSIDLDNGATLTAISSEFDKCFKQAPVEGKPNQFEFKTRGKIVNKKFRKSR